MSYVRTVVDGVPVLWARSDGPLRAGLVFRVGRADESLARGGITHLVEHLALHRVGQTDHHSNGTTAMITTAFYTQGNRRPGDGLPGSGVLGTAPAAAGTRAHRAAHPRDGGRWPPSGAP